ncbi:MAG: c-type cytochrome [Acetobacteraceae bacterium]
MSRSPERRLCARLTPLALAALLATLASGGIAQAAPPGQSPDHGPSPVVSQQDLAIWQQEGAGAGALAHDRPRHPPGYFGIGTTPSAAEIAGWSIAIPPDGAGLPPGQGSVAAGGKLFESSCAVCHGSFGEGNNGYPQLVGGVGSLGSASPQRTVGSYWPYATTLFDYIDRAMPFLAPHTLKPDQVYSLVAWILNANGIVAADWIADADSVPLVRMPAVAHWNWRDPRPVTHNQACMSDCANPETIHITSTAVGKHLTPRLTGPLDRMSGGKSQ